jgi:glutamate synthase (NADPH/NADH) small chain
VLNTTLHRRFADRYFRCKHRCSNNILTDKYKMTDSSLALDIAELFPDLHPRFDARQATLEAHRCLNCFDAPCMGACPTHIDVPKFIKKIASGNVTGSARTILEANVLGASCGRVCPVDVLCEGACVMHSRGERAIEIGRLQRFAVESYYNAGGKLPLRSRSERKERVACIGAGPASLACAAELRQHGFGVTIFDKRPLPGGLNTYGVAEYKLRANDSLREVEMVRNLGVQFVQLDIDAATLEQLEREFDAIFLGVGLGEMNRLDVNEATSGVIDALEFIASYKTGNLTTAPARVIVIGAGNTAIDAACAAKRLGAVSSTVVYRRRQDQMSAFAFEYDHALREGVAFVWESAPIALRQANGALELECVQMTAGPDGRLVPIPGSNFTLACDLVIPAIGQSPLLTMLQQLREVMLDRGRVVIDRPTGQTTTPRYFAGGDCVNGGREVVDAVADGKRAALGIAAMLGTRTEAHLG